MRPTQISKAPIAAEKPKEPGNSSGSESLVMSQSREMFNISSVESMSPEKPLEISSVESLNAETSVKRRKLSSEHSLEISSIESLNPNQSADNLEISSIESLNPYTMLTASEMMGMEMCNQGSYQGDSILPDDDGPEPEPEVTKPQPQKRTVKYTVRQFEGSQNTIPLKRPHESMANKSLNKKFLNSTCNDCGRKFVSATNLKLHVCTKGPPKRLVKAPSTGKVEPVLVQKQYKIKCLKCNLVFNNQIAIREHMKVHSNEASAPAVDKEPTKTPLIVRKTVNVWNGTSTKPNPVPSPNQNRTIVIRRKITPTSNGSATSSIVTTTAAKDGSALIRRVIMPKQSTPQKSVETIKIPVISSVYQVKTDNKSKEYVIGDKLVTPKEEKKSGQVVCESYQNPQDQENFEAGEFSSILINFRHVK